MHVRQAKSINMTTGSIWRELVEYAIPLLLGNVLQQFYTVIDCITVGRLVGKEALAAISATELIVTILLGMFIGISTGASITISQFFGADDREGLHDAVHTTAALTIIMGIIMTVLGILCTNLMLKMASTPEDVMDYASLYLKIYFAGILAQVIYNMSSGVLRAIGDSKSPLIALIITSVLNIALDVTFVAVFHMGVAGVAIATIISQIVSAIYLCVLLFRTEENYRLIAKDIAVNTGIARKIFHIGVPIGLERSIVALSNTVILSRVNLHGSAALAGWGVFRKIEELVLNGMQSMSLAVSTFVGQNLGAGKLKRAKEGTKTGMKISLLFTVLVSLIIIVFRKRIVLLFNNDAKVVEYGSLAIIVILPFIWMNAMYQVAAGEMRGIGNGNAPMIVALTCFVLIRQAYLFQIESTTAPLSRIFLSFPVGWFCAAVMMFSYMLYSRRKELL